MNLPWLTARSKLPFSQNCRQQAPQHRRRVVLSANFSRDINSSCGIKGTNILVYQGPCQGMLCSNMRCVPVLRYHFLAPNQQLLPGSSPAQTTHLHDQPCFQEVLLLRLYACAAVVIRAAVCILLLVSFLRRALFAAIAAAAISL